ncbi:MAG: hypothetical protein ACI857_000251 [Arenicella sp.]
MPFLEYLHYLSIEQSSMENTFKMIASPKSPEINGDIEKGTLSIKGKSLPEDAKALYSEFKNWLDQFYKSEAPEINVSIELEYYNTVSSKLLLAILNELNNLKAKRKIEVEWRYDKDDIEMEETGDDFKKLVGDMIVLKPLEMDT